jgi:hypothetical protein
MSARRLPTATDRNAFNWRDRDIGSAKTSSVSPVPETRGIRGSTGGTYIGALLAAPLLLPVVVLWDGGLERREVPGLLVSGVLYLTAIAAIRWRYRFTVEDGTCRVRRLVDTIEVQTEHIVGVDLISGGTWAIPRLLIEEPELTVAGRQVRPAREEKVILKGWSRLRANRGLALAAQMHRLVCH